MASPPNVLSPGSLPQVAAQQAQPQAHGQAASWQGGYDCDFVQPPPKCIQSECPICHMVLREPYQVECCGKVFCRACIERNDNCPTCRKANLVSFRDKGIAQLLGQFEVFCCNRRDGCKWKGELGALGRHLNESPSPLDPERLAGCDFVKVNCTHCAQPYRRCSLDTHENTECQQRPCTCDHCRNFTSTFEDVAVNHHPVCERYPVPCPNNCQPEACIARQDLASHVKETCPLTVIECEFDYVGCGERRPRESMHRHIEDSVRSHLTLLQAAHPRGVAHGAATSEGQRGCGVSLELSTEQISEETLDTLMPEGFKCCICL